MVEGFGGSSPAECLSWAAVECSGDRLEFVGVPTGRVGALGKVLPQQAVGVRVRASLPGVVWVGEADGVAGVDRQPGVLSQFLAAFPSERPTQLLEQRGLPRAAR